MRLLQKSSLLIFIPAIVSIMYRQAPDAIINAALGATSVWHHTKYTNMSLLLDRTMICVFTCRLLQVYYSNYIAQMVLIIAYGYLFYSYIYGYYNQCYCFHRDLTKSERYHAVNHLSAALLPSIFIIWNGGSN